MKTLGFCTALVTLPFSGCMTGTVIHDARHPAESDSAPWANYLLLPITVPADIVTSPIQLIAFVSYGQGDRPHGSVVPISEASATNNAVEPTRLAAPKFSEHD